MHLTILYRYTMKVRYKMITEPKKTKRINIPLEASTHTWIKMECAKLGVTISELIEMLIKEHIEQEKEHGR